MPNDTTLLLGLDGVSVVRVERLEDGTRRVHLATDDEGARACPVCGVISVKPKGTAVTRPRDLPCGEHGLGSAGTSAAGTAANPCARAARSPSRPARYRHAPA